jgi:hypothetical protein
MTRSQWIPALAAAFALTLLSAAPPHHLPPCIHGPFEGITQTLADGTLVGEPDARDWGCVEGRGAEAGVGIGRAAPTRVRQDVVDPGSVPVQPPPPPTATCISPAAPNPAHVATRIQFTLPASAHVSLTVYGRHQGHGPRETFVARSVLDGTLAAGTFSVYWDLTDDNGDPLAPGIYRAVLVVGDEALCGDVEVQ